MPKLTKSIVDRAEPREKQFTLWCSDLSGFGCFVNPTGTRTYFVDYRNTAGVRRRMSIGRHGKITTEEARKLAVATLGSTVRGEDPHLERTTRRKSLTVAELCDDYLAAADKGIIMGKRGEPKKASTLATDRGRVERHIKPLLGRKLVIDMERADIVRFINDVSLGKTAAVEKSDKLRGKAIVEGGRGAATRTAGLLGGILSFAVSNGVIEHNPSIGVKRPADGQRRRRLTAAEFQRLGSALAAAESEGDTWQAVEAVWLLALTGCRLDEIISLRWNEIDAESACFRLESTKEGASVRPIGGPALERLQNLTRESAFVLPAVRGEGAFGGMPRAWKRIMSRAQLEGVTAHTLRHSYASVAGDLGFTDSTIATLLGHTSGSVTSRYVHRLDAVLVAAADKVAGEIGREMRRTN